MKKLLMCIIVALTATMYANAQSTKHTYTVKGVVTDSTTHAGEPYATIAISLADSIEKPLKQAITDMNGRFTITGTGTGQYLLSVRAVGRKTLQRQFNVEATTKTIDLDTLLIQDNNNELGEVQVVAYKPLVKADIDKLTYSIEDDPESKTNTIIEMLKKVPMVTVDGQDKIQVNGSTSFKIYVNGKPNNMMTKNPTEVLRAMPASNIKKIEVITNPGPKYDAEGIGGILNIITNDGGPEGYNATLTAGLYSYYVSGGGYATIKQGKLTMSVNYNNVPQWLPTAYNDEKQIINDDAGNSIRQTTQSSTEKSHYLWHGGDIDVSYEIDTLRLISGSFSISQLHANNSSNVPVASIVPSTGETLYSYNNYSHSRDNNYDYFGSIDYQRSFANVKDRMLTLSYRLETGISKTWGWINYDNLYATADWTDFTDRIYNQRIPQNSNTTEHTFQIDYTTPFAKHHTWESGVKYILRQNKANNDRYNSIPGSNSETFDSDNSTHFRHRNDIFAAYMGYGYSLNKWSARLGLRYEHTLQKIRYLLGHGANLHKNFNDWVPSVKLGYKLNDASNISLSYQIRIFRPSIYYLNPYLDESNPQYLSQGNPSLVSQKRHDFRLQYSNYGNKFNYTLTAQYSFVNNSIESITSLVNDQDIEGYTHPTGKEIFYKSYANIGKFQLSGLQAYANWTPWQNTRITFNGYVGYKYISDNQSLKNYGWGGQINASIQQTFAKTWVAAVEIYKSTPSPTLRGKNSGYFQDTYALSKSFMDKRLNIKAYIVSPFRRYYSWRETQTGDNFYTYLSLRSVQQLFGIRASLRIGKLKADVKHADRTISNDDVLQGSKK